MTIDLTDIIGDLQIEVNPPGSDNFPDAVDDDWVNNLRNSFWEAKLYGFFGDFTESDGMITSTGDEMGREYQQLIVLFAAARIIRNELKNKNTMFRAQAGPVEFETQNSATLLRDILKDIRSKVDLVLATMTDLASTTTQYVDSLVDREDSIYYGDTYFWR